MGSRNTALISNLMQIASGSAITSTVTWGIATWQIKKLFGSRIPDQQFTRAIFGQEQENNVDVAATAPQM